jgi:hypothetical protein
MSFTFSSVLVPVAFGPSNAYEQPSQSQGEKGALAPLRPSCESDVFSMFSAWVTL